jgi:hypothetical protein
MSRPDLASAAQVTGALALAFLLFACGGTAGPRYILTSHYGQRAVKSLAALESVWGHAVAVPRPPDGYTLDEVLIDLPNGNCAVVRWSRRGVAVENEPMLRECPTGLTAAELAPAHPAMMGGVAGRLRTATPAASAAAAAPLAVGFEWPDCGDWMEAYVQPTQGSSQLLGSIVSAAHDRCAKGLPARATATPS